MNDSNMWKSLGQFILRNRVVLLVLLLGITAFMGFKAKHLELSYGFINAIPTDHPKYLAYQEFRNKFGEDGNLLVIGVQTDKFCIKNEPCNRVARDRHFGNRL